MEPPTQQEVERVLSDLVHGRLSREQADRWASRWVTADEPPDMEPAIWTALTKLFGCDLRHGAGEKYLHDREDFVLWVEELRHNAAT